MSGQTRSCRARYSASRSGLTRPRKQTRSTRAPTSGIVDIYPLFSAGKCPRSSGSRSEVELADVVGGEDERRAEQDGLVRADRVRAELARGELLALTAVELARRGQHRRVAGQVAEVVRLPQHELLDGAVGDVLLQRVRRAEPGQRDLAAVLGRVEDGRRGGDPDGGGGDDALQVRVPLEQSLGHLGRRG